jgi:hypothetical protein
MDFQTFLDLPVIDGHIHFSYPVLADSLSGLVETMRLKRVNLVATPDAELGNHNPALIHYKLFHPDRAFLCGAVNYLSVLVAPNRAPQELRDQVLALKAAGFDGLKLLESKPMVRKVLGIPLDSPVYEGMWAAVEELGLPVVWHVADPEEFWDPKRVPDWAVTQGWFYGDGTYPTLEGLYQEVQNILTRHPALQVILAHFFFLSEHLHHAADFLDAHPNARFDLTPGSEMFFNFSRQPQQARDFFLRYRERLIFGSDIGASAILQLPPGGLDRPESLGRAWVVRRFLECDGEVVLPAAVGHWARGGERIEGIALPPDVLAEIYSTNFERLFGLAPVPLVRASALELLERLAAAVDAKAGRLVESPARQVARELRAI